MKILHSPTNVGNQPWVLSRYERKLGHKSKLFINYSTSFNYPADKVLGQYGKKKWQDVLRRIFYGFTAPFTNDVLHYYFGRSLLYWDDWSPKDGFPFLDLKIAKALGKKIFFTLQGCDVRLAGESNNSNAFTPCHPNGCSVYAACVGTYDQNRRDLIAKVLPLCDKVFYLNPELGHFVPTGNFLPYSNVDIYAFTPIYPDIKRVPRIVHAPSDGLIKGTPLILDALEKLRKDFEFELILVQGKTNAEALEIYRSADIAIDQVLTGWYGGVSVELMAMGKPVLCYLREADLKFVPEEMLAELPIKPIRPDYLIEDIAKVLEKQCEWLQWGMASRRFVERWHNPAIIANAMIDAYKNPGSPWRLADYIL
jgi:glycosyltransferase involved in cell wall biosynthesis